MKISELPKEIREKALEYQRTEKKIGYSKTSDDLNDAFSWKNTLEGLHYWNNLDDAIPEETKPAQYEIEIDTFERAEKNMNLEERLACARFNIDKYNWRKKEQDKEDFEKIIKYAQWAIKQM